MDTVLNALDTFSYEELKIIEKRAGQLKRVKGYFSDMVPGLEDEKELPGNYSECREKIKVVNVSDNEETGFRDGVPGTSTDVEMEIEGIDSPVKLSYIQSQTKHTYTQYRSIMIGRKRYEFGFGDFYEDYMKNSSDATHVLQMLHNSLNISYDKTVNMIHMLFFPYSWYTYIEDNIESLEDMLDR